MSDTYFSRLLVSVHHGVWALCFIVLVACGKEVSLLVYSNKCGSFEGYPGCTSRGACWGDLTRMINRNGYSIESRTDLEWAELVEASGSTGEQVRAYASTKVFNFVEFVSFNPSPERISKADHIATAYNYYAYEICYDVRRQLTHLPKLLVYLLIFGLLAKLSIEVKKEEIRAIFARKKFSRARDELRCLSCNENVRDVLLRDCKHISLCARCVTIINPFQCPICAIEITTEPLQVDLFQKKI